MANYKVYIWFTKGYMCYTRNYVGKETAMND